MNIPAHRLNYEAGKLQGLWKTPREYLHKLTIAAQQPGDDQELVVEALRAVLRVAVDKAPLEDLVSWSRQLEEIVYEKDI